MEILAVVCLSTVVCLVAAVSGWSSARLRRRDTLAALPDNAPLLEITPLPKAGHRAPLELLTVVDPWKDSDSQEWEYVHHHPRRMSILRPSFNTQHETPPAAFAPLRLTKGDARVTQDLLEQQILETPLYIDDDVGPSDHKETVFIRNVAQSSENNHASRNKHVNRTSHSAKSDNKRKNIFQLIKHLEFALDVRRRKIRPKPSGERYKIIKEHVHNSAAPANETHYIKHFLEKSYNRNHTTNNLEVSQLTLANNDNQDRKLILSDSGHIQKIGKSQKSEEDWINIATNEVKQDISNSDDSLLKSVENESELTEHAIANIIKQLRDILTEDSSDTVNEDSHENIFLLQKYISSELEPELVTPTIQTSQIYTDKTSSSLWVDSSLKPVSSITHAQDNNSVLPLVVHPVSSSTSASVELESDMSSSEASHNIIDKSIDSDHVSTSDSSYLLPQSQESSSNYYGSKEYLTSPTSASQSQMSGSAQDISTTAYNVSLDHDSSISIYEKGDHLHSGSEMYNKYEKNLDENIKNDSFKLSNEIISYLLSSTENKDVLPLTTTEEPILDTRHTLVTESNNTINIYGSLEKSVLPNITNSNEIANVTKLYKVLNAGAPRNFSHKLPSTETHSLGTVSKDVTDVLTNMLLSDSDIDLSDHILEQNAIDNLFEDIAQELGETVQLVAKAANAKGLARKEADIGNVARNRPDRAVKTYNLAFHFNK